MANVNFVVSFFRLGGFSNLPFISMQWELIRLYQIDCLFLSHNFQESKKNNINLVECYFQASLEPGEHFQG